MKSAVIRFKYLFENINYSVFISCHKILTTSIWRPVYEYLKSSMSFLYYVHQLIRPQQSISNSVILIEAYLPF